MTACALVQTPGERASAIASATGFTRVDLQDRRLTAFLRRSPEGIARGITVYIESDGAPWPWPDQPPSDPTPLKPLVLGMAGADESKAVAYLSRPCQYLPARELEDCDQVLWTGGRFREDAVAATVEAVERLKRIARATEVNLVGYSGGGAMAALVAARRTDVRCLVTVAAPLDIDAWSDAIGVSRLRSSMNPANVAARLDRVPQTHFRGLADRVVPFRSVVNFLRDAGHARVIDREDFDHECCWLREWKELRARSCLPE